VIVCLLAFGAFVLWPLSYQVNYKLSIDIDDNSAPRHGEGVIEVQFLSQPIRIDNTPNWSIGARGEAFAVDLGERGTMFVLLSGESGTKGRGAVEAGQRALGTYFHASFGDTPPNLRGWLQINSFASKHESVEVDPSNLPMLVRFRDTNDPASVERVEPNALDASFGPGVKITRVTAQLTDEPMTTGIEKRLPWVSKPVGSVGKGMHLPYLSFLNQINDGSFRRGFGR